MPPGFAKPEYLFRPSQLMRRCWRGLFPFEGEAIVARLPWGYPLEIHPRETIGRAVWHLGIYELVVNETLWRLARRGDVVADVGANIGAMTALMAHRVGPHGQVYAFEPNPTVWPLLSRNVGRWQADATVEVHRIGLSDHPGTASLMIPPDTAENEGLACIGDSASGGHPIEVETLDGFFAARPPPRVMKIDVEGHEEQVLRGGRALLASGLVAHIVFEEHRPCPTPTTELLEGYGYAIFRLERHLWGPGITTMRHGAASEWEPTNYLATRVQGPAQVALRPRGWQVLRRGARRDAPISDV